MDAIQEYEKDFTAKSGSSAKSDGKSAYYKEIRLRRLVYKYIVDHIVRQTDRPCLGILLGSITGTTLEIEDTFPLVFPANLTKNSPFKLDKQLINYHAMIAEGDSTLQIFGWYRLGKEVEQKDLLMHSQMKELIRNSKNFSPILLLIDDNKEISFFEEKLNTKHPELIKVRQWEHSTKVDSSAESLVSMYLCESTPGKWKEQRAYNMVMNNTYKRPFARPPRVKYGFDEKFKLYEVEIDWPHEKCKRQFVEYRQLDDREKTNLEAARQLREKGFFKQAKVLIEKALKNYPNHPELLDEYDLISDFFTPLEDNVDNEALRSIYALVEKFDKIPRSTPMVKQAIIKSFYDHVWSSVAIEGSPITRQDAELILKGNEPETPPTVTHENEVIGLKDAFKMHKKGQFNTGSLNEESIWNVHRNIMTRVDDTIAGFFRHHSGDITPGFGQFKAVETKKVEEELGRFISFFNHTESEGIDIIEMAALAHFFLVSIHPFSDGNGRTCRFIMGAILIEAGLPFILIPAKDTQTYFNTSIDAHFGNRRSFLRFVYKKLRKHIQTLLDSYEGSQIEMVQPVSTGDDAMEEK
ncbi:fic/DOC family domain-containing protein [Ditylenchus destructor]|nr:fic/DOC family domain-containing protein [Ditylenchus destructor]